LADAAAKAAEFACSPGPPPGAPPLADRKAAPYSVERQTPLIIPVAQSAHTTAGVGSSN
jgi:hypothetical protein